MTSSDATAGKFVTERAAGARGSSRYRLLAATASQRQHDDQADKRQPPQVA